LIYFIDHIAKMIRVNYIITDINLQTVDLLPQTLIKPDRPPEAVQLPLPVDPPAAVVSTQPGYIQGVDAQAMVKLAQEYDLIIRLNLMIGHFVAQGGVLLHVWPQAAVSEPVIERLHAAFDIGPERTIFQDILFGIRQLVDIALKAISPAINDPTTAVHCLDAISNILVQAAQYPDPSSQCHDAQGTLRLIYRPANFAAMVDLAFSQIRQYARSEVAVTARMLEVLVEIAQTTSNPHYHEILWEHACLISRSANANIQEPFDRQKINEPLHCLAQQLGKPAEGIPLTSDKG
jgi:uncharacterized membrane protein